ncbi:hypothetical protein Hanom_Chr11g01042801 [Helianthus anomalus]
MWIRDDDKKNKRKAPTPRTPKPAAKGTPKKKTTPHLVDEPSEDEVQPGGDKVIGGEVGSSQQQDITIDEIVNIMATQNVKNAEKTGDETVGETGGENVVETGGETRVEGMVRTYSSEIESDNFIVKKRKEKVSKKRKDSLDDDTPYVLTRAECKR